MAFGTSPRPTDFNSVSFQWKVILDLNSFHCKHPFCVPRDSLKHIGTESLKIITKDKTPPKKGGGGDYGHDFVLGPTQPRSQAARIC